jgi:hypothetical protein
MSFLHVKVMQGLGIPYAAMPIMKTIHSGVYMLENGRTVKGMGKALILQRQARNTLVHGLGIKKVARAHKLIEKEVSKLENGNVENT